jgi:hypothetical protein
MSLRAGCFAAFLLACGARPDPGAQGQSPGSDASAPDVAPQPTTPPTPPPPPLPLESTPVRIALGAITPDVEYTFTIPPNALAFNVALTGGQLSVDVAVKKLVSPTGVVVLDQAVPAGGNHEVTVGLNGTAAAESPQTDAKGAMPLTPGTWTVVFSGPRDAKLVGSVVVQVTDDGKFHGGLLDMHVYVPDNLDVKGIPVTASTAQSNADIEDRVAAFFARTALHAAVYRGIVTYHRIAPTYHMIDDATELARAFQESKVVPDGTQAIHVVFTESITFAPGHQAWGIASGIPGASTRSGTVASGVALAFLGDTPEEDAEALEHEIGHFFGLSHTTEFQDGLHDPLIDTPTCDMIDLMACPDNVDVMFPTLIQAPELTQFTLAQSTIFATNPAVRLFRDGKHGNGKSIAQKVPHPPSARVSSYRCVDGVIRN